MLFGTCLKMISGILYSAKVAGGDSSHGDRHGWCLPVR